MAPSRLDSARRDRHAHTLSGRVVRPPAGVRPLITTIDKAEQVERLLAKLRASLPVPARVTPELVARLLEGDRPTPIPMTCSITWITYAGDEGGIICRQRFDRETANEVVTSITHLRFDPSLPLAREITAYQKHRVKRLKRQS